MQELTKIQEINQAIMFGNFTSTELESIVGAIKFARAQLAKQNARAFKVGDSVRFRDIKRGNVYFGSIERIKLKYALVRVGNYNRYNVPLNLLESDDVRSS